MKEILAKLVEGKDLTKEEAMKAQELILTGQATEAQIACFLTALRMKGETLDEITGLAAVLRNKANTISPKVEDYVDFVGTGGDCTYSFNISTTSAFVVVAAGLPVAKHGNRSISSKSGAGDVLEALGVNISADPAVVEKCVETVGIGFMFAPHFNPAMKYVGPVRKQLGIRMRQMLQYYKDAGQHNGDIEAMIADMKPWYDNYCFAKDRLDSDPKMFNCDMVLYYLQHYIN